ncbi:amidohydrolase [Sinomonas gamaensis]|uniref:amidohydrolase n=1 Tax=Sinomonas gamaensis TaxID=2565624 RepID=UPI0023AFCBEF|nr:amidohydrolase family protein [Sinomonas gamaensis]
MTADAEVAIVNADVLTMDASAPQADAVAIAAGRVTAVGSDEVGTAIGPATTVVDAKGGAVLPGINDAHLHFTAASMAAFGYVSVDAAAAPSWAQVAASLERAEPGDDGWIRARGWDDVLIGPAQGQLLDVRPGVPVIAFDATGHQLVANRDALERAGLTRGIQAPEGGVVGRDADGELTGVFQDGAMELLNRALPPIPQRTLREAMLAMQRRLHALGITSLTEPGLGPASAGLLDGSGSVAALRLLGDLAEAGELTLRTTVLLLFAGTGGADAAAVEAGLNSGLAREYSDRGLDSALVRIAGVKVFADGIPRSGTAWMTEPYGDHCTRGSLVVVGRSEAERVEELARILELIDAAGLQAGIHATGDAATGRPSTRSSRGPTQPSTATTSSTVPSAATRRCRAWRGTASATARIP